MNYSAPMTRNTVTYASVDVRMAFVRKIYGLFYTSLLLTVGVGWLCTQPAMLPVMTPLVMPLLIAGFVIVHAVLLNPIVKTSYCTHADDLTSGLPAVHNSVP